MKIAVIIVRVLFGLLFIMSSVVVLFNLVKAPEPQGSVKVFMDGVAATIYLLPLIKITELTCGIAFVIGRFVPLATVIIFPVTLNILLFHACVAPEGLGMAIGIMIANLFLAYAHRKHYVTLVAAKASL